MIIRGRRYRFSRLAMHVMRTAFEHTRPAEPDNLYTHIGPDELAATFVGHATVLLQWKGLNIVTDPNFAPRVVVPKRLVEPGVPPASGGLDCMVLLAVRDCVAGREPRTVLVSSA